METLTYPILVGIAVPWLVALMTSQTMTSNKKRWITIFVTIAAGLLVALGVAVQYNAANAEEIVKFIGVVFGTVAIVYAAFKNHGIDWLRAKTDKIVLPTPPSTEEVAQGVEAITGLPTLPPNTDTVSASIKNLNAAGIAAASTGHVPEKDGTLFDDLIPLGEEEDFDNVPPSLGRHVAS